MAGHPLTLKLHPRVWAPTSFAVRFAEDLAPRVPSGGAVLELGVGSGVLSILAARLGAEVTGLDLNVEAIGLASENWVGHGLPSRQDRFRESDRFAALREGERFDLIFSNPPVLPDIGAPATGTRDDFEVAGDHGRRVLEAMLTEAGPWLAPGGSILTIATSLQGWGWTETQLAAHWGKWEVVRHVELALTDECGDAYVAWWQARSAEDGERRIFRRPGDPTWWHDVWILAASQPRS